MSVILTAREVAKLLPRVDPSLDRPVYVVDMAALGPYAPNTLAYTHCALDAMAQPMLEQADEWHGRGIVVAMRTDLHPAMGPGLLVHEVAHALLRAPRSDDDLPQDRVAAAQAVDRTAAPTGTPRVRWAPDHGFTFVRAVSHVCYRLRCLGVRGMYDCFTAGEAYGLSEFGQYMHALTLELHDLHAVPFAMVWQYRPPAAAIALWCDDVQEDRTKFESLWSCRRPHYSTNTKGQRT